MEDMPPQTDTPTMMGNTSMAPTSDEKTQATICWVLTIFAGFIPGLIFWLMAKEKPYLFRQAALSLTLGMFTIAGFIVSAILMIVLIGFLTYAAFGIYALVVCIMGAIACNKGDDFSPALISGICKSIFKV